MCEEFKTNEVKVFSAIAMMTYHVDRSVTLLQIQQATKLDTLETTLVVESLKTRGFIVERRGLITLSTKGMEAFKFLS